MLPTYHAKNHTYYDNFARENWIQQKIEFYKNNFQGPFDMFEFDFISKRKTFLQAKFDLCVITK